MDKEKLVTVKIRDTYRNMAKAHAELNGGKMYRLIEQAIENMCAETLRLPSQHVK